MVLKQYLISEIKQLIRLDKYNNYLIYLSPPLLNITLSYLYQIPITLIIISNNLLSTSKDSNTDF